MGAKLKKTEKASDILNEIYDSLVELTEKQKKVIEGASSPDRTMAGKLERYVKAKAELIARMEREEQRLTPAEAEALAERRSEAMGRLHEMESRNIMALEKKINALGADLLGMNYSKRLKSAYAGARSTPQPRFFDRKDT